MDINEYKIGNIYYLIEATTLKNKNLDVFKAKLTALDTTMSNDKRNPQIMYEAQFVLEDGKNTPFFILISENEKNLKSAVTLEYDGDYGALTKKEQDYTKNIFGTLFNPKAYILCENFIDGVETYSNLLNDSLTILQNEVEKIKKKYNDRVIIYSDQIKWLRDNKNKYVPVSNTI